MTQFVPFVWSPKMADAIVEGNKVKGDNAAADAASDKAGNTDADKAAEATKDAKWSKRF